MPEPDPPGQGIIDVGEAASGGSTAFSAVDRVASDYAHKADNLAKLEAASDAKERHLFIWVESSRHDVTVMLDEYARPGHPHPTSEPLLPDAVDCVWMATGYDPSRAWSFRRDTGWIHHGRFRLREVDD